MTQILILVALAGKIKIVFFSLFWVFLYIFLQKIMVRRKMTTERSHHSIMPTLREESRLTPTPREQSLDTERAEGRGPGNG